MLDRSFLVPPLTAVLVLAGCSSASPETAPAAFHTGGPTRYPAAARVVALGDVHGDLAAMRQALWLGGVLDEGDHWVGGDTVVVQTGDVTDRGDDERAIIDLLKALQTEARDAGGALHLLQGNHELMNVALDFRYVTEAGFRDFDGVPGVDAADPALDWLEPHARARASAFKPGGVYARKLAEHPVVLVVGDTAFAHGGVLPDYAASIEETNRQVTAWLLGDDAYGQWVVDDDDGPVWSRHYSDEPDDDDCRLLDEALTILGVARMVVGHTVQDHISSACDDQIWRVDVGMAAYYEGTPEVLELSGGEIYTIR